jgi:hypothetical protein
MEYPGFMEKGVMTGVIGSCFLMILCLFISSILGMIAFEQESQTRRHNGAISCLGSLDLKIFSKLNCNPDRSMYLVAEHLLQAPHLKGKGPRSIFKRFKTIKYL